MPRYAGDAVDVSNWTPPSRTVQMEDGDTAIERFSSMRGIKVVCKQGHVRFLALENGSGKPTRGNPYEVFQKARKLSEDGLMVPYGACPKAIGLHALLPAKVRGDGSPCKAAADGHPISDKHACKCVEDLIELRKAANDKNMAANERRLKPREAIDAEQRDAIFQKLAQNPDAVADAVKAPSRRKQADQ